MTLLVDQESLRCPTCRAVQPWSDTCRRCKCDLRLLRVAAAEFEARRTLCLRELHARRPAAALVHARACRQIRDDDSARRLVATCALLSGDWPAAVALAAAAINPGC